MDLAFPFLVLTNEEKKRMRRPWKTTLIIKLLGRSIGSTLFSRKIKDLWKPKSSIELIAIKFGYFLVKFSSLDDYNYAKFEGP